MRGLGQKGRRSQVNDTARKLNDEVAARLAGRVYRHWSFLPWMGVCPAVMYFWPGCVGCSG